MADVGILERLSRYGFGEDVELPIDSIEVPEEFQRELKPRNWAVFAPPLFGRPGIAEVVSANGRKLKTPRLLGVDGQHRIYEAKVNGYDKVPCTVVRGMSLEDAAGWFDLANHARVGLPAQVEFRAACMSLDSNALALDEALLERGLDAWPYALRAPQGLRAISSVRVLADQTSLEHTLYTLDVLADIWPWPTQTPAEAGAVMTSPHVRAIRGFGQFLRPEKKVQKSARSKITSLRRWNKDDRELLVGFLRQHHEGQYGLESLIARAEGKSAGGGGGSLGMELTLASILRRARKEANEAAMEPVV
jgi:hypothetical protein